MKITDVENALKKDKKTWLVTGVAGFIGSHLLEKLLLLGQKVVGLDNLSTGHLKNFDDVKKNVGEDLYKNFNFIQGDVSNLADCKRATEGVDIVLHQAALGSVPRSVEYPIATDISNVNGFVTLIFTAKEAGVKRIVYASSSSVYGDNQDKYKLEDRLGNCLSPYAVSKRANELYASTFNQLYGIDCIGLRYFNVFGSRQDPNGAYAAVIPKWIDTILKNQQCTINGDGLTSRDFCYIKNVVQANILAATAIEPKNHIFNVACGDSTNLKELQSYLVNGLKELGVKIDKESPIMGPFRVGDIRASLADITRVKSELGYKATHSVKEGLEETVKWYAKNLSL